MGSIGANNNSANSTTPTPVTIQGDDWGKITFSQVNKGDIDGDFERWESDRQVIDAAIITRNDKGEATGVASSKAPRWEIERRDGKYRVYERNNRGRHYIKSASTIEGVLKQLKKYNDTHII